MTVLFPYIFSFVMGYLVITKIPKYKTESLSLTFVLALGLGLGIVSALTFLSFLIMNRFSPSLIIALNVILLCILVLLNLKNLSQSFSLKKIPSITPDKTTFFKIFQLFVWIFITFIIYILARDQPYGQWDAWALWNMKGKFLILSGESWRGVFDKLHWHTQPDYPVFLPLINIFGYALSNAPFHNITLCTAVLLTVSCGILLYAGLREVINEKIAFLASCLLLVNPYYVFMGTSQYADILLGYYLLASLIVITLTVKNQSSSMAILSGCFLGLLPFVKNEGIPIAAILLFLVLFYTMKEKDDHLKFRMVQCLLVGLLIGLLPTIIFKYFLSPSNRDILTDKPLFYYSFLNLKGLSLIKDYTIAIFLDKRWQFIWLLVIVMFPFGFRKYFLKEAKIISFFLIFYILVVIYVYLTTINFDLSWRLSRTLYRIFFYLLPSIVFLSFYVHWKDIK